MNLCRIIDFEVISYNCVFICRNTIFTYYKFIPKYRFPKSYGVVMNIPLKHRDQKREKEYLFVRSLCSVLIYKKIAPTLLLSYKFYGTRGDKKHFHLKTCSLYIKFSIFKRNLISMACMNVKLFSAIKIKMYWRNIS